MVKYPRTYHLPWSPGVSSDDKILHDLSSFYKKHIVVTIKMDGENTTIYKDNTHARSLDSPSHWSRSIIKALQGKIGHNIPDNWRVCGENLYATHSIKYTNLESYFLVFSIWDENNMSLSWSEVEEWCELLGLTTVPVIYKGIWNQEYLEKLGPKLVNDNHEGFVVRLSSFFHYDDFTDSVVKYVRPSHVTTEDHWRFSNTGINSLKDGVLNDKT
jgi:hypothetical protein